MIYHDEHKTQLDFGSGDILIHTYVIDDDNVGVIGFEQLDKCYEIGCTSSDFPDLDPDKQDAIMTFSNVESIDTIIRLLQYVKDYMMENKN